MFLYFNNGKVKRYYAGTIKRFLLQLRSWSPAKIDILVSYGRGIDAFGKEVEFTNQYLGSDKKEAMHALRAFLE